MLMWTEPRRGTHSGRLAIVASGVAFLLVTGCAGDTDDEVSAGEGAVEGVSRDELEYQAEPMTLEEAERLGIVDTTIGLADPANPDSIVPLDGQVVVPFDTSAPTDTSVAQ